MSTRIDLTGRVAVVTGAGSGIGRATALMLARHGAKVHVADLNRAGAEATVAAILTAGGRAVAHMVDVADSDAVEAFAATVFDKDGRVDVLHNNAGIGHAGNIAATSMDDWRRVVDVNLLGVGYGCQAFAPRMLNQGHRATIINTASEAGLVPMAKMAPYAASKFGVVGLSESLNAELSKKGVRVVALCPGVINTPIVASGITRGDLADQQSKASAFYEKYGASPEKVAEAVLKAIDRPRVIVVVPKSHVLPPWWLRRISPRLVQPIARNFTRLMGAS